MRIFILYAILLGVCSLSNAQMHDNVWTLGYSCIPGDSSRFGGTNLYFDNGEISSEYECRDIRFKNNLSASISDKEGNLLMMFNGCTLYNADNTIVEGSEILVRNDTNIEQTWWCIDGYNTPHSAFFLPNPYDDKKYHLFYRDIIQIDEEPYILSDSLYVANIIMNGDILNIQNVLAVVEDTVSVIGSSVVKHSNGIDWWIIIKNQNTNIYHTILLDESGPHLVGNQKVGNFVETTGNGHTIKISPDGEYLASFDPFYGLEILKFNRFTGVFEEYIFVDSWLDDEVIKILDIEFSPSSQYLYIAEVNTLWQFDMSVPKEDFFSTKTTVGVYDGFTDPFPVNFWLMQNAPDGKIYMSARNSSKFLHVIHNPNEKGQACNFRQHDYELPTLNARGLPYFPNFRLGLDSMYVDTQEIISAENSFIIFPNPASDYIEVKSSQVFDELRIYDVNGNMVEISDTDIVKIDDLLSGIYFVKAYNNNIFSASSKFVVGR